MDECSFFWTDFQPANIQLVEYGALAYFPPRKQVYETGENKLTVKFGDINNPSEEKTDVVLDVTFNTNAVTKTEAKTVKIKVGGQDVSPDPVTVTANVSNCFQTKAFFTHCIIAASNSNLVPLFLNV